MMDVSGAWVRKPEVLSVEQMNAWADEKERQFTAKHLGSQTDPLNTEVLLTEAQKVLIVTEVS